MRSSPLFTFFGFPAATTVDSDEKIAQELASEGLSGVADQDTYSLNARLDHQHVAAYDRRRRKYQQLGSPD